MLKEFTHEVALKITKNLKDFGYSDILVEEVEATSQRLIKGEEVPGIIAMFARNMLEENGYIQNQ
jgi:hypothetical protein